MNYLRAPFILSLLTLGILTPSTLRAADDFKGVSDVDIDFLLSKPKLPWGVDPFMKLPGFMEISEAPEKFTLTGVSWSKENPIAIINGATRYTGDRIGSWKLSEIGSNYVLMKKGRSTMELTLPPVNAAQFEDTSFEDEEESDNEEDL